MIQPAQEVAHSVSQCPEKMEPPKPEVSHGAEQSAVPEGPVNARILRAVRFAPAV
jgi:hypothetical protein